MWRLREKVAIYKPRREVSERTNCADPLISDIQPPEPWENECLLFKPPSQWYSVIADLLVYKPLSPFSSGPWLPLPPVGAVLD